MVCGTTVLFCGTSDLYLNLVTCNERPLVLDCTRWMITELFDTFCFSSDAEVTQVWCLRKIPSENVGVVVVMVPSVRSQGAVWYGFLKLISLGS